MTMKQKLLIFLLSFAALSCAHGQQHNGNTATSKIATTSTSITTQTSRGQFLYNLYIPRGASPSLFGGLPISGGLMYDTVNHKIYKFDSLASDGTTEVWTPLTDANDIDGFVTLSTVQTVAASKTWNADQIFQARVGIGGAPSFPFDVQHSSGGRLYFDGSRVVLKDPGGNTLMGSLTGLSLAGYINDLAIGDNSLRLAQGSYDVALGTFSLSSVIGDRNTAGGVNSLMATDSSDNTAFGFSAGHLNYGSRDVSIGSFSGNYVQLASGSIDNSEIQIPGTVLQGATTAAYITANSLVTGQSYPLNIHFNGAIPIPYGATTDIYVHGKVTNSNTIVLATATFSSQGSGTMTVRLYSKQDNSIAIGYNVQTTGSNQIAIGNSSSTLLKMRNLQVDLASVPSAGDALVWDGTKYTPTPVTSGSGSSLVASVFGRINDVVAQSSDYAAFYPSLTGYNNTDWNTAYNKRTTALAFSGTTTKTLTLTYGDGTTTTASFTDNTGSSGTGITSLNGETSTTQSFATGTAGTDFNIVSGAGIHTFNLPTVSSSNRGLVTSAQKATWDAKQNAITTGSSAQYLRGDLSLATFPTAVSSFSNDASYLTPTSADARYPQLSVSYANPSWLSSIAWAKVTGEPTTLSGYGITDGVPSTRTINSKPLSSNITLAYSDLGVVPITNGGTGQITATAAINALLPSQTGQAGKVLGSNGANISWVANSSGVSQTTLDDSTAAIRADFPDCSPSAFTSLPDVSEGSGSYIQTVTITATTVPSGITTHTFYWTKYGHEVQLQMNLKWATAGNGVTKMTLPLPTGIPNPLVPSGFNAPNDALVYGSGGLSTDATARTSTQSVVRLSMDAAGTGYLLIIESNSTAASTGFISIHYRIP
jgi:hypothetical protein